MASGSPHDGGEKPVSSPKIILCSDQEIISNDLAVL